MLRSNEKRNHWVVARTLEHPRWTKQEFSNRYFSDLKEEDWSDWKKALAQCTPYLKEIYLDGCLIGSTSAFNKEIKVWLNLCNAVGVCWQLESLNLAKNSLHLITKEDWASFDTLLRNLKHLQTLNLQANELGNLSDENLEAFKQALAQRPEIETLILSENDIKNLIKSDLGSFLKQFPYLKTLDLSNTNIGVFTDDELRDLGSALAQCLELRTLHLGGNNLKALSEKGWQILGDGLEKCPKLEHLDLRNNDLYIIAEYQDRDAENNAQKRDDLRLRTLKFKAIGNLFTRCFQLKILDLGNNLLNNCSAGGLFIIMEAVSKCLNLEELRLGGNYLKGLSASQWTALKETMPLQIRLRILDLGDNDLGKLDSENRKMLKEVLINAPNLAVLNLSDNRLQNFEEDGWIDFGSLWGSMPKLKTLILKGNNFDFQYCKNANKWKFFCGAIGQCTQLEILDLEKTSLKACEPSRGCLGMKDFGDSLELLKNLHTLSLKGNLFLNFNNPTRRGFWVAISQCSTLEVLNIENMWINPNRDSSDWVSIKNSLISLKKLHTLYFKGNVDSKQETVKELYDTLKQCPSLKKLGLDEQYLDDKMIWDFHQLLKGREPIPSLLFLAKKAVEKKKEMHTGKIPAELKEPWLLR